MKSTNKVANKRFRHGSFATVFTILVLAMIVAINVICSVLVDKFPLRVDLTSTKVYELSDESKQLLDSLGKDVKITLLSTESEYEANGKYFVHALEMMKKYASESDKVTLEYVDTVKNPNFISNNSDVDLAMNDLLFTCGSRKYVVKSYDLFNFGASSSSSTSYQITSSKAEQAIASAIQNVTSDKTYSVMFMDGHEETALAGLSTTLTQNGFNVTTQSILTQDIPDDVSMIFISAPVRDFTEQEIAKLDDFLHNSGKNGKNLFFIASSDVNANLPNLYAFLEEWGIKVGSGWVYETDMSKVFNYNSLFSIADYTDKTLASKFIEKNVPVAAPQCHPLDISTSLSSTYTVTALLGFTDTARLMPSDADQNFKPSDADEKGPFGALVKSAKAVEGGEASNVFACGSSILFDDSMLTVSAIANGEYILNLINGAVGRETIVNIVDKTLGGSALQITQAQANIMNIVFSYVLPVVVVAAGIVVWLRRRHK